MTRVLVTRILPPQTQARLVSQNFELIQWDQDRVDALLCLLTDKINDELLDAAGPQLKVIATMSVGYDHIDTAAVKARQIQIGYTPDVLTDATADLTVLLTLGAARRIKEAIQVAENGQWREWRPTWMCGSQLSQKTVGIVGMGRIGEAVATRLRAFGVSRIVYSGRNKRPVHGDFVSLDELLTVSDFVFVNSARGGIVDQEGLVKALEEKLIGSAGLDVTDPEPLPPTHKLYSFSNCLILPHIGSATLETREQMAGMSLDNILAALNNQPLPFSI
ncbi:hypothetical protein G6F56_010718 [Rhizopus delemar]|nr:hypothetical protein G6F56_010718 [Rhizopus delemar]